MSRHASAGFIAIIAVATLIAWQARDPATLVTEADTVDSDRTMAAGVAALADALTPTVTPYVTTTPTRTPKPPTSTPRPTYGPDALPGRYVVLKWTEVPAVASTLEPDTLPACDSVTPAKWADQPCEVAP